MEVIIYPLNKLLCSDEYREKYINKNNGFISKIDYYIDEGKQELKCYSINEITYVYERIYNLLQERNYDFQYYLKNCFNALNDNLSIDKKIFHTIVKSSTEERIRTLLLFYISILSNDETCISYINLYINTGQIIQDPRDLIYKYYCSLFNI